MQVVLAIFAILCVGILNAQVYTLNPSNARVIFEENEQTPTGYKFSFETDNDITRGEEGKFDDNQNLQVNGYYSFQTPDGQFFRVDYVADENGYRIEKPMKLPPLPPPPSTTAPEFAPPPPLSISSAAIASLSGGGLG